jgi:GABA(A) receptor-associated protein
MATPKPAEIDRLRKKYPDRVPVFLIKGNCSTTLDIPKNKFLVPSMLTLGEFTHSIRKLYKLDPSKAMYFFINDTLPNNSELISVIHDKYKHADGTLHLVYSEENTFG